MRKPICCFSNWAKVYMITPLFYIIYYILFYINNGIGIGNSLKQLNQDTLILKS